VRDRLHAVLSEAVRRAIAEIDPGALASVDEIQLVPPKVPEHGDFATNAALVLAKRLRRDPMELARRILASVHDPERVIERAEVARPGFINVFVARGGFAAVLLRVLREGERYGHAPRGAGPNVQVEFVSANPTGPLTIGHGRNAVLGDCVARLLEASGARVSREFYFNDAGRQMRVLGESLRARYLQALGRDAALPEDAYHGDYLREIAEALVVRVGESFVDADVARFTREGQEAVFAEIRQTLVRLGIAFDSYFNEASLYRGGEIERTLADLRAAGVVYESEGAVWLRATALGLERDRVLVKSSGEPTYLLPDVAYHRDKYRRGFERMVDVLGPDHLEQFPYVQAALRALGYDPDAVEVVHYQWVNLRRGGELVKMSKRAATFVTVDEVLDDVGADVFRWFMIDRRADTHLDFDLELARERSERNPVYKVQYAHARLCSIERQAAERGVEPLADAALPLGRLEQPAEIELLKRLGAFPDTLARAARLREPQEITRYLLDLASEFHAYVTDGRRHRVLSDDPDLLQARLALVRGIRGVLANGLGLLGVGAPERM
jgi:arginyl-tRNA synthetase